MSFSFSIPNQAIHTSMSGSSTTVLDFSSGVLPSGVTFSRASSAHVFSSPTSAGIVAVDVPRFGVDPRNPSTVSLLVEDSATNLLPYARPTSVSWTSAQSTLSDIAPPSFGYFGGITIASNGFDWGRANMSASVVSGMTYCVSTYLKAGTSGRVRIVLRNTIAAIESRINGGFGAFSLISGAGTITNIEDHVHSDGLTHFVQLSFTPNFTGSLSFGVGPDSAVTGQTVDLLAAQIETASTCSSFIDTGATSQTRSTDILGTLGLNGTFDVTATFADGSQVIYPAQNVTDGYWPTGLTGFVRDLSFA